ncbi:MAG: CHASE2 domain-containing protein [Nitrospirae bacterium]|nr:CHASE2 domain-containing protein [Nitrospirota bacterium]
MKIRYIFLTAICIAFIFIAEYLGFFTGINHYLYDLSFRIRGDMVCNKNIIIVAIDEKSLNKLGRWPLRRINYVKLIERIEQASAIGFDIIMSEPSEDDEFLGDLIKSQGRVIMPIYIDNLFNIIYPIKSLSPHKTGHIHIEQDIDGVVRSVFHTLNFKNTDIPSFTSAIYETITGKPFQNLDTAFISRKSSYENVILQKDIMYINFYGNTETFKHISLVDVIEGHYPLDFFKNKVVLVGVTAAGIETKMLTPFTQKRDRMSGIEIHANILNNLIDKNYIKDIHPFVRWLGIIILSVASFIIFININEKKFIIVLLIFLLLITVIIFTLFILLNLWIPPTVYYFSVLTVFFTTYIFKLENIGKFLFFAKEEWEKTFNDINEAIIVHDIDFNIIRMNKAAEEMINRPFFAEIKKQWNKQMQNIVAPIETEKKTNKSSSAKNSITYNLYDPDMDRFLEIKTIARYDAKNNILGAINLIRDITEWKQAEEKIKRSEEELRNLTAYLHKVTEIERTNIAREIHDELGSSLTVLKMDLSWLKMKLPENSFQLTERINEMISIIDKTIKTMKRISTDLRPGLLDDLGLAAAIEWQAQEFQKRTGIKSEINIVPKNLSSDKDRNTAIFRIFQETLTNIARHAHATKVNISLMKKSGNIELQIQDNGKGITEDEINNPKSFGLIGMRERVKIFGGNIIIKGMKDMGTQVTVKIPFNESSEN